MDERLTFGYGVGRTGDGPVRRDVSPASALRGSPEAPPRAFEESAEPRRTRRARTDWAYLGVLVFTGLLYFRPQDILPALAPLRLTELAALGAIAALVFGRLSRGLTISRLTPELIGVLALGAVMVGTAPFSIWPGGVIGTFTDVFLKIVLIFVLIVNTVRSPRRIEQLALLIVVASAFVAGRAVFDYVRGVNLIEQGRVQGAVGGMFRNPNDLALNMVVAIPLAAVMTLRRIGPAKRMLGAVCVVLMIGAIVASQSRSGTVGLGVMSLVLGVHLMRRRPGLVFGAALAGLLALPLLPSSYWHRLASITNEDLDQTGSREARSTLLEESLEAFAEYPLTGVGAGQFKVYNPKGRAEAWRETHNVVLQVASELGVIGLLVFGFLVARAAYAPMQAQRLVRRLYPRGAAQSRAAPGSAGPGTMPDEPEFLELHAAAMSAAVVGWFVCALFASVAYYWTFYYVLALAAAPREYLQERMAGDRDVRRSRSMNPVPMGAGA